MACIQTAQAEVPNRQDPAAVQTMLFAWADYLDGLPPGEEGTWNTEDYLAHWLLIHEDTFGPEGEDPGGMTHGEAMDLFMALFID